MASIGFIGLGNMGGPMVRNLVKAGHTVKAFDLVARAIDDARAAGAAVAATAADAAAGVESIITMLPSGRDVREVYLGDGGVLAAADAGSLLVDCSTIDVVTAREVGAAAAAREIDMIDAPVSGGVSGAKAATLTFMIGGSDGAFTRATPILESMGKTIVHAGGPGSGQAAKICNQLILGVTMIAVGEAFVLGEKLGLTHQKLFDIAAAASGQCWALTSYCPVPGPVPASPANRDYAPGFTVAMMLKDLRLAQDAAQAADAATPLGAQAAALYALFAAAGRGGADFSAIITMLRGGE